MRRIIQCFKDYSPHLLYYKSVSEGAVEKFHAAKNRYAADMLFVLNATSLQLIPTTVIALRASFGSSSPADILLPSLLATAFSTLLGALLVALTAKRKRRRK